MKVSLIPLDEVCQRAVVDRNETPHIDIFERLELETCELDCQEWRDALTKIHGRASNRTEKKAKRKAGKHQRQALVQEQRDLVENVGVSRRKLREKRKAFSWEQLKSSATSGCGGCKLFSEMLDLTLDQQPGLQFCKPVLEWVGRQFILCLKDSRSSETSYMCFFTPPMANPVMLGLKSSNLLNMAVTSAASLETATGWISDCENHHERCGSGRNVPLPKRCLDLEPLSADGTAIRLSLTEGEVGTYACLSHCWGPPPKPIQTSIETLEDRLREIRLSDLPKTFKDAVGMARKLQLRYLWIDSLCIVQDSAEDWAIESSKMADIYQNSFLTIAAISSPDSRGGLFPSKPLTDLCFSVQIRDDEFLIGARWLPGNALVDDYDALGQAFPALTRAWIYQERILSRRILSCTYFELQLDCRQAESCECGNVFMPPHVVQKTPASTSTVHRKVTYSKLEARYGDKGRFSDEERWQHWQEIVKHYTNLDVTFFTDRLPALSGCARDVARVTGDEYVAGLWRSKMAEGLAWIVNEPVEDGRSTEEQANALKTVIATAVPGSDLDAAVSVAIAAPPSWSWAFPHTRNGISYISPHQSFTREHFRAKIEKVSCEPLIKGDITGRLKSGYLRLRVALCPAHIRQVCRGCAVSRPRRYLIDSDRWLASRSRNCTPCPSNPLTELRLRGASAALFPDHKYRGDPDLDYQPYGHGPKTTTCRLAPVFLVHLYDSQATNAPTVTDIFLVLRFKRESTSGNFERIGLYNISFVSWKERQEWMSEEFSKTAQHETVITIV